jgi:hypothetical protein
MATANEQRRQMIRRAVVQRPEAFIDVTICLWQRLASELCPIIGEGGFQSLYARSLHVTSALYPWITDTHPQQQTDFRFNDLIINLKARDVKEASEASIALLSTFIDILAGLIGELLTNGLLQAAWGEDALDIAIKEFGNE